MLRDEPSHELQPVLCTRCCVDFLCNKSYFRAMELSLHSRGALAVVLLCCSNLFMTTAWRVPTLRIAVRGMRLRTLRAALVRRSLCIFFTHVSHSHSFLGIII